MISRWRIATLGVVFLALLVTLTIRLWFLQVAEGQVNAELAQQNQTATVRTEAPRGEIVDRYGVLLAGTRASQSIVVNRKQLTLEQEEQLVQRVAVLLGVEQEELRERFADAGSGSRFTLALDVPDAAAREIMEWGDSDFPGVEVRTIPVRLYPNGARAAHVIGYLGKPDQNHLDEYAYLDAGDEFGRAGIERYYDEILRGERGTELYQVDSVGKILSRVGEQQPESGYTAVSTLDLDMQIFVEEACAEGVHLAEDAEEEPSGKAVCLVMNARDGSVHAMASIPSFDPNAFVGGISRAQLAEIQDQGAELNLAIQGLFPPASTFKVVPYVMAIEEDIWPEGATGPDSEIYLDATVTFDLRDGISQQVYRDWTYPEPQGITSLRSSIPKSADVYYYQLALSVWEKYRGTSNESLLQDWARRLSLGSRTGIDLPFENPGLVPDAAWLRQSHDRNPEAFPREVWVGGDLLNLTIGQGDLLVTPLQLATAYAALVNGGTVWQPRVVSHFIDNAGDVVAENEPTSVQRVDLDPATVAMLRSDLRAVVNGPNGTARATFADFGPRLAEVGGKTGTAEIVKAEEIDTAWFVGVAPINDPEWVVAVVIDRGGGGSRVAAPVAKAILQYLLNGEAAPIRLGEEGE